jgi:predicted ATPase
MASRKRDIRLPAPYLRKIWLDAAKVSDPAQYPFCLPLFRNGFELHFDKPITIIVGENGTGKSTLLEGIGSFAGYDEAGGGKGYRPVDHSHAMDTSGSALADAFSGRMATENHQWLVFPSGKFLFCGALSRSCGA